MGIDVLRRAIAFRAVSWGRARLSEYDIAIFVNDHIGEAIIATGIYEKYYLENTDAALSSITGGDSFKQGICLDIGANIGNHALFYSKIFKRVIAFEPNPIAYKLFQASILKNRINNIDLMTVALGSAVDQRPMILNDDNLGMGSLVNNEISLGAILGPNVDIERGDILLRDLISNGDSVSFIKMDIEGYEANAIIGLREVLQCHCPIIAIELNFATMNDSANAALKALREVGYNDFFVTKPRLSLANKWIDFLMRILYGERYILSKLNSFEEVDYLQVYCSMGKNEFKSV
jgi:FkbM family methyltransferase